jgi:hypothetical protein
MRVVRCEFFTVIRVFKMLIPSIQTEFTRIYNHVQDSLFICLHLCNRIPRS